MFLSYIRKKMGQIEQKKDYRNHVSIERLMDVDFYAPFFDVFREAYGPYFSEWWQCHTDDEAYVVKDESRLVAFLKLKFETEDEDYSDMTASFPRKTRLKICSLKIDRNVAPKELSTYFMRIVFTQALLHNAEEIYGTVAVASPAYGRVARYLEKWGFLNVGKKFSHGVEEDVFVNSSPFEWSRRLMELGVPAIPFIKLP